MTRMHFIQRVAILLLCFSVTLTPELALAAQDPQPDAGQVVDPQIPASNEPQPQANEPLPDAPSASSNEDPQQPTVVPVDAEGNPTEEQAATPEPATSTEPAQTPATTRRETPLGTAAAEEAPTAGGAASRPAGVAIAPAKQKRSRSLLIKIGALAAGAAALGTIYALSRGTASVPPGATQSPR